MEKVQISSNLLQSIANYLGTKPFNEVAGFITALQQELNVKPTEEIKEEDKAE